MMNKSLDQIQYYQVHYRNAYFQAKAKGKKVLRRHLQKLSHQVRQLQKYSATIQ